MALTHQYSRGENKLLVCLTTPKGLFFFFFAFVCFVFFPYVAVPFLFMCVSMGRHHGEVIGCHHATSAFETQCHCGIFQ